MITLKELKECRAEYEEKETFNRLEELIDEIIKDEVRRGKVSLQVVQSFYNSKGDYVVTEVGRIWQELDLSGAHSSKKLQDFLDRYREVGFEVFVVDLVIPGTQTTKHEIRRKDVIIIKGIDKLLGLEEGND